MARTSAENPTEHPGVAYSYRETPADVWRNRVGVTGTLFAVAMMLSYALGRPRP